MTEIVDDRQRLVARLDGFIAREQHVDGYVNGISYADLKAWRAALASPSEGNKKGEEDDDPMNPEMPDGTGPGRKLPVADDLALVRLTVDLPGWADDVLAAAQKLIHASRPQEQPRKATGEAVAVTKEIVAAFCREEPTPEAWGAPAEDESSYGFEWHFADQSKLYFDIDIDGDGTFAVLWRKGRNGKTVEYHLSPVSVSPAAAQGWQSVPVEATEAMLHAATMIAPTWDDATSRAKYAAMVAAAPPSPAAQEQEK